MLEKVWVTPQCSFGMDSIGYTITCIDSERDSNGSLFTIIRYRYSDNDIIAEMNLRFGRGLGSYVAL